MDADKKDNNNNDQKDGKQKNNRPKQHRRRPQQQQQLGDGQDRQPSQSGSKAPAKKQHHNRKPANKAKGKKESEPASASLKEKEKDSVASDNDDDSDDASSEASGDLCFICTEPIVTYAVGNCDHRTCHLCALRLRALYKTKNCALCKSEQTTVILTKDSEKPFESYSDKDAPLVDKKLGLRFEDKQIQQDTKLLLQYNCPDPDCDVACDGGWGELKRHVKKAHDRFLCDLCTRHKKIFAHEHTLYTYTHYQKHCKYGDKSFNPNDDTGFKGHPECHFCRVSFYGDDELYEHCRDKHEQCHICVRQGIRHEYYDDYDALEKHFKKEHFLCVYRECLDRKFVVFDTDIDLKAHEVEEHGASMNRLPRSKQVEARRVDVGFDYGSSSSRGHQHNERNRRNRPRGDEDLETPQPTRAQPSSRDNVLNDADFPGISGQPHTSSQPQQHQQQTRSSSNTTSNSSGSKRQQKSTFKKPAGFGALSDNWPTLGQSSTSNNTQQQQSSSSSTSSAAAAAAAPPEIVSRHAAFMERVFDMFKSHDKLDRFRALTTAYRNSNIDVDTYVSSVVDLCDSNAEHAGKIFKGVEDLMDNQEKKWEVVRAWRNKHTAMENFPVLDSPSIAAAPAGHGTSSRVLVIKSRNTRAGGTRSTGKSKAGVWDRVASAASGASSGVSPRSSPHTSRPSSPAPALFPTPNITGPRTAWAGGRSTSSAAAKKGESFPSLGGSSSKAAAAAATPKNHFPSLPTVSKRQPLVSMRRNASNPRLNAWGGERPSEAESPAEAPDEQTMAKKKKGKKNKQVLLRVGL
ncbi:hypothetical protein BDB00DRAFT_882690 [Zychaea mexicana]|uniref:uncharacterized protein n=1 Tax=Zychaea mexicana TaxID=64656 RepID=UPI0022FEF395|nr:uncharacterized protein BDB00DRAFT_882690 [Zychaea mexicana]KAI9494846.1 hypothetical protein BDB00DRAFT_882690 [Zychaea mexicana]